MPNHRPPDLPPLLAVGAHPDDIEFGCGGVIAREFRAGRPIHFIVCSRGEAGTNGTPEQRAAEALKAASLLGATLEFVDLGGDAHIELRLEHTLALAERIRRIRPGIILAPTAADNQHPDHTAIARIVRNAARLARYGGVAELRSAPPHAIGHLLSYAVASEPEPHDPPALLIDVSPSEVMSLWIAAMEAHASQLRTRNYIDLQLARARANGLRAGAEYAIALFPNDPLVFASLGGLDRSARQF